MNGKVTHAVFHDERICETAPLYQYDYGQVLMFDDITLPETYEVFFSNNITEPAYISIGTSEGALIPDILLQSGKNVLACVFLHEGQDDGETEYVVRIPVRPRSHLSEDQIPESEHSIVSDLITIVQELQSQITFLENRIPALGGWKTEEVEQDDSTDGSD